MLELFFFGGGQGQGGPEISLEGAPGPRLETVTLKTGLGFVQGHWNWHHLVDRILVPIRVL